MSTTENQISNNGVRNTIAIATVGGVVFGAPVAAGVLGFAAAYKGAEALVDRYQPGERLEAAVTGAKERVVSRFHHAEEDVTTEGPTLKTVSDVA